MMDDLISRQALCEYALNQKDKSVTPNDIMRFPSAQPVNYGSTKSDSSSQLKLNNDLISRQAAIDTVSKWFYDVFGITESDGTATIFKRLRELPPAQPERKKGMWIKLDMHAHLADHKCTACGQECYVPTCMGEPMYVYCPNCGSYNGGDDKCS